MDSVGVWEWDGKNINIFVVSKMVQWFQEMLIIEQIK